ncbi:MAG: acetyl-CoA carboxylase biotin carboxyl carrier protein [Ignavibacteriales bacterium]|nr:acetyl-CoA carboxylase biotin carboxyl carrier protein [Ignavibacteriales bacterium]
MDITYLKKLVKIVEQSTVDEIEIEEEGLKIRVAKNPHQNSSPIQMVHQPHLISAPAHQPAKTDVQTVTPNQETAPKVESKLIEVKSPIVGTFYRAPAPDADSYVEVGTVVQPKQVLCIIEAMKLMNEIESDVSGRIVKILVENAKPVEYNQTLFLIEPV